MGIRILKGGMLTTVQDSGRPGYQSQGFGVSGVMDRRSFKIANLLLDNPENEAVLEFTLLGPTLEFTSETIIAITGGDFQPQVNGKPVKMYTAICTVEIFSHFVAAVPEAAATSHFPVIWKSRSLWEAALPTSNVDLEDLRDAAS